jgi:hypothetical protein
MSKMYHLQEKQSLGKWETKAMFTSHSQAVDCVEYLERLEDCSLATAQFRVKTVDDRFNRLSIVLSRAGWMLAGVLLARLVLLLNGTGW